MLQAAFEPDHSRLVEALTRPARLAPESGIVEIMNYGRQRGEVMPLWAGEGDLPTPAFISDAAARALADRCRFALPDGAFYLLFSVEGETDTRALAKRIIDEAGVGLAPGSAFGAGGESFLRLCFARDAGQLQSAAERLAEVLGR